MKTINEMLQQLNTMQSDHINTLEQQIKVISEHRQHLNETISNQAKQIKELFRIARIDNEVISDFKKIINQQDKQIIDLQKENDNLFFESCANKTTLQLQKEVKEAVKE